MLKMFKKAIPKKNEQALNWSIIIIGVLTSMFLYYVITRLLL